MHITRILIENFQRHERLELFPSPDSNAIVGSGDQGKSAIVRSIKWCLTNQPDGDDFVRFWYETDDEGNEVKVLSKQVLVELELSTGYIIRRIRTPKTNNYEVIDPKGEKTVLANFRKSLRKGQLVPDAVLNATGVGTITLGETPNVCVQIQDQHDAPFLIGGISAPARWRAFSHLAGTEAADKTIRSFNAQIHSAGSAITEKTKSVEADRVKLVSEQAALLKVQTLHDQLADLFDKVKKAKVLHEAIDGLIADGMRVNKELHENRTREANERKYIDSLSRLLNDALRTNKTLAELDQLGRSFVQTNRTIGELTAEAERLHPVASLVAPTTAMQQLHAITTLDRTLNDVTRRLGEAEVAMSKTSPVVALANTKPNVELFQQLCALTERGRKWQENLAAEKLRLSQTSQEVVGAEELLRETLQAAGQCPRCRQDTTKLTHSSCT